MNFFVRVIETLENSKYNNTALCLIINFNGRFKLDEC